MANQDLFKQDDFRQQYELAKQTGDKRFGSECKHINVKNGHCTQCLRKVVTSRAGVKIMAEQQTAQAVKYIRYNVSRLSSPTWVHIASGQPFEFKKGRYGRFSSTVCGKEFELDDYSVVKDEQQALAHLCKSCARQRNIEHQR